MLIHPLSSIALGSVFATCSLIGLSESLFANTLTVAGDRETITAGEPLIIMVTLMNSSSSELFWRTDQGVLLRTTTGPNNLKIPAAIARPTGVSVVFSRSVRPKMSRTV